MELIEFTIHWLDWRGKEYATRNINRKDIDAALAAAAVLVVKEEGAYGFFLHGPKTEFEPGE